MTNARNCLTLIFLCKSFNMVHMDSFKDTNKAFV